MPVKVNVKIKKEIPTNVLKSRNIPFVDHKNFTVRAHISYGGLQLNSNASKLVANNILNFALSLSVYGIEGYTALDLSLPLREKELLICSNTINAKNNVPLN